MNCTVFGLDLAKRVFQLHWVDIETGEMCRRQLKRQQVAEFFANRNPGIIAMEACGSAHYWGRKFAAMGHEVRLIAGQFVRPFVCATHLLYLGYDIYTISQLLGHASIRTTIVYLHIVPARYAELRSPLDFFEQQEEGSSDG